MKHLTLDERIKIQEGLDLGYSIRTIARSIDKSASTVMREIERHKQVLGRRREDLMEECAHRRECTVHGLCKDISCRTACKACSLCKVKCHYYSPAKCELIKKSPYVCNGCPKFKVCTFSRITYSAAAAQNAYKNMLIESREGIAIEPEELIEMDKLVSPLLLKGQSIDHIFTTHKDEIPCCKSTLYRYVGQSIMTARNGDMPRKVRHKKRKKRENVAECTKMSVLSRNYTRYLEFAKANPDLPVVEMDTVVGSIGSHKALLTLLFRSCNLMLIFLLPEKTQECVIDTLNNLSDALGIEVFQQLFPVILTDRGMEFYSPEAIECDRWGEIKTHLFYCDPQCSWQKPQIERNHEFIRYILPKGTNFDFLTEEHVWRIMNHINSYSRPQYNGSTPYLLSKILLNPKLHETMNLELIDADDVTLKPELLRF